MYLLVDDIRNTPSDFIARTYEAAELSLWSLKAYITVLILDHDLGEEKTGYDLCVWALEHNCLPREVQLVTSNPVGRENIKLALINAGYASKNGLIWSLSK